jgi:pheromone a factor receptor
LANNKTTRSRFLRLYILCALCSFVYFPINIWIFYANAQGEMQPFSWTRIHHPTAYSWNSAVMVPNNGELLWDRYVWLAGGALVFILFGFGRDAIKMYRDTLLSLGFGKIFPDLIPGERSSVMASMSSMGSKAKVLWGKRKGSETSTSFAGTKAHSLGSTTDDEMSPRKTSFVLETIVETRARAQDGEQKHNTRDGSWDRFTKRFREASATPNPPKEPSDHFIVTQVENQQRVEATISSEPDWRTRRSTGAGGDGQVLVHKEVRQNSETA